MILNNLYVNSAASLLNADCHEISWHHVCDFYCITGSKTDFYVWHFTTFLTILYQAMNVFFSAVKLYILPCESMGTDSMLEPLLDATGTAAFASYWLRFWRLSHGFIHELSGICCKSTAYKCHFLIK